MNQKLPGAAVGMQAVAGVAVGLKRSYSDGDCDDAAVRARHCNAMFGSGAVTGAQEEGEFLPAALRVADDSLHGLSLGRRSVRGLVRSSAVVGAKMSPQPSNGPRGVGDVCVTEFMC